MTKGETLSVRDETFSLDNSNFWFKNRYKFYLLGFVLRLLATPFDIDAFDYATRRRPVAIQLADGKSLYNDVQHEHMPIYPYLTALMIFITGSSNQYVTAFAIKLPLVIFDSIIPLLLFRISIQLQKPREGLYASIVYALNPISLKEVALIHWDGFASFFILLGFYLMLKKESEKFGIVIALGFFTKEFPLFLFGIAFAYWRFDFQLMIRSALTFIGTSLVVLFFVLVPFGTPISYMMDDIFLHPIYNENEPSGEKIRSPMSFFFALSDIIPGITETHLKILWAFVFFTMMISAIFMVYRHTDELVLVEMITLQLILLSIFFISIHTQFLQWVLPWLLLWAFIRGGKAIWAPVSLMIAHIIYHAGSALPYDKYIARDIIIIPTGIWVLAKIISYVYQLEVEMKRKEAIS